MTGAPEQSEQGDRRFTVMVVDDDPNFLELLVNIFNTEDFEVITSFKSLEQFTAAIPSQNDEAQSFLPDLLVLDVMSSRRSGVQTEISDGATVATLLRSSGLDFSVLLLSSMQSHHFELYGSRSKWEFIRKSSRMTPEDVLQQARKALGQSVGSR